MRLVKVKIIRADSCGGLLDGFECGLREKTENVRQFQPLCLIGPNGTGKSQFLQIVAEIFQSIFAAAQTGEERVDPNPSLEFEVEYLVHDAETGDQTTVRARRSKGKASTATIAVEFRGADSWESIDPPQAIEAGLLPTRVIGYTSGDNETLSLPFLISRASYAEEVATQALAADQPDIEVPDTRLSLIDYGTHLEVLVANLTLGSEELRNYLLAEANLDRLRSFRCTIQLSHSAAPKPPRGAAKRTGRKGIQLTPELEESINRLKRCATCWSYEEKTEHYTFDFFVDDQTRLAFATYWDDAFTLYSSFHKLAMLNDLAIPRRTRERFRRETNNRRFATRLPEPQDEEKVFKFERVNFNAGAEDGVVDYVSLSDGEHQLAQVLGTFAMICGPNALILLDEPESHFNPKWRVKFISKLMDLPTAAGLRRNEGGPALQDCLITTHAPFLPSDMPREDVLIFSKSSDSGNIEVRRPNIETFGTTFDGILEECFAVRPPISGESRQEIERLKESTDIEEIKAGIQQLGDSIEKVMLADRVRQLMDQKKGSDAI